MTQEEIFEVAMEGAAMFAKKHKLSAYEENFLANFFVKVIEKIERGVKLDYVEVWNIAYAMPQFDAAKLSDITLEIVHLCADDYQAMFARRHFS